MNTNLSASIIINNKNNVWISDHLVSNCYNCQIEFGYLLRKHHCRNCGNIFCYKCSNKYISIPHFISDRPTAEDYWNISYYIKSLRGKEERVCDKCYFEIVEKTKTYEEIIRIFENPIPIDEIKRLTQENIKNYYFDHLRNIQYYLPNHVYSDIDRKLLKINALYFCKHSKYIVHLIKSINWDIYMEDIELVMKVLQNEKTHSCNDIFCTRTCQEYLSFDDCVNILYIKYPNNIPNELIFYLFDIIEKTPENIIICHLPFFVYLIKIGDENLHSHLYRILSSSEKIIYQTYWFLSNERERANISELMNINKFIELFDTEKIKIMYQEYLFFFNLIENLSDPKRYLLNVFDRCKPISLPYEPEVKITEVDIDNIEIKSSYTKPVLIPFQTTKGKIHLLFKKESIINDVIVINLITLSNIILNENLGEKFNVIVYPIIPITQNSGMIEIIREAETIHSIYNKKKTILQFIIEKNENKLIADVLDKYMYSLVCYTLHNYFIGLGDRHLQNIMITHDGSIFHIDFGFIMGLDTSSLISTEVKLNSGMLDVIGGSNGDRYRIYLDICSKGIIILRKYFSMFFILLAQIPRFKIKHVEKFIMAKFQPRQTDNTLITELLTVIKKSNNNYSQYIRDFLHYHNQEKTFQNSINEVIKTAISTIKRITI